MFLIADSIFLSCSSGLKEFKISTLYKYLHKLYKYVIILIFLHFYSLFFMKTFSRFVVLLYKGVVGFIPISSYKNISIFKKLVSLQKLTKSRHTMIQKPGFYPSTFAYSCFPPKDLVSLLFA